MDGRLEYLKRIVDDKNCYVELSFIDEQTIEDIADKKVKEMGRKRWQPCVSFFLYRIEVYYNFGKKWII